MKIAIVGAGGVGGYVGAKLIHARDADVTVVARGKHLDAIHLHGLHVNDEGSDFRVHGDHFTNNPAKDGPFDCVVFCTKSYDLEEAAWHMSPCINATTLLFALCNGVGHDETLRKIYPHNPIASACIYILSNITAPGHIKKYGGVFLMLAGMHPVNTCLHDFATLCNNAGLKMKVTTDAPLDCWRKYLFISALGTMTAYYDEPMGQILSDHKEELLSLLAEIVAVANAKNIALDEHNITQCIDQIKNKIPYNATTSMQLDIRSKHRSEIEALSGYISREGKAHHVKTPVMDYLYQGLLKKQI